MAAFYRREPLPSVAADVRAAKLAFVTSKSRGGKVPLADFAAFFAPDDDDGEDRAKPDEPMTPEAIDRAFGKWNVAQRPAPCLPPPPPKPGP